MSSNHQKRLSRINKILGSEFIQKLISILDDGTIAEYIGDWKWIFSYSIKYRWVIVFYTLLGIFGSSLSLGAAYISRILINIVVEKQFQNLWILITTMLLSTVFSVLVNSFLSRLNLKISIWVNNDIQAGIFDKIIDAQWQELNRYPNGDLLNRFNNDVGTIANNAIGWIPNLIINIYTFAATFIMLFRMDPTMAWIAILSAPVLLLMSRYIMRRQREYRKRVLEMNSQMTAFEVETFFNFDSIKSFGITDYYSRELRKWQERYKEYNLDYNTFQIKTNIQLTALSTAISTISFGYCLYRLWTGQILYGDMTFFLQQRSSLSGQFSSLVATIPGMLNSAISAHRIRELVDLPKEVHDPASLEQMKNASEQGITVQMQDVTFAYREGQPVYEHTDFIARPNEIVAVLGSSGKGKTTMLRLVLGLISPETGAVTLNDAAGNAIPINADLRKLFSYVPQGNTAVSGTIAENMRLVKEGASDEEIIAMLKQACAWEFVEKLPQGIETKIGEKGKGLSEGQAQRLSLARALLRDCPILLLDEATSALDMSTEEQVLHNIIHQRPNKTCIVSTHRPSVLSLCQRIYRIENGKFIELTEAERQVLISSPEE